MAPLSPAITSNGPLVCLTGNYTSDYQKFDGQTVLSNSDTVYQNVFSDSSCAKLCTYYTSFNCKSFDYCPDLGTCFLGRMHFYDVPKANIKQEPMCDHYSREFTAPSPLISRYTSRIGHVPERCSCPPP